MGVEEEVGQREGEKIGLPVERHRLTAYVHGDDPLGTAVELGRVEGLEIRDGLGDAVLQLGEGLLRVGKARNLASREAGGAGLKHSRIAQSCRLEFSERTKARSSMVI